ncbi:hypothetical protein JCM10213_009206 [Rhodosporidiobolus nylandii]
MSYRQPSYPYHAADPAAYELQSRYSQQFADSAAPTTPAYASSSNGQLGAGAPPAQHNRWSSADLYALDNPSAPAAAASRSASASGLLSSAGWNEDSSDEDEDGPGFGSYAKEEGTKGRRSSQTLSVQEKKRTSKRASLGAPPLLPSLSSTSTLPPPAHLSQHQQYPSTSSFTPYGLPYNAVPGGTPSSASFGKLPAYAGGPAKTATDTVEEPILSKHDWGRGEGIREKHVHGKGKTRQKREAAVGGVIGAWLWVKRRWRWTLPLAILFAVAIILLCYFLIPRTPTITFTSPKVPATAFTSSDPAPYVSSAEPTAFSFDASLTFAIDASDSYLPVHYKSFGLTVKLIDTGGTVAHTVWDNGEIKVAGGRVTSYEFPITFHGNYSSANDRTFQAMHTACAHRYQTTFTPQLNLTVEVESSIIGVVNPPVRTASLRAVDCPVEWAMNAS